MTDWVKIDENMPGNRKVCSVPVDARWAYVASICYSAANDTDGEIPLAALPRVDANKRIAAQLVEAGLWESVDAGPGRVVGYVVHDYLKHNRSKTKSKEVSAVRAIAGSKGRAAQLANAGQNAGKLPGKLPGKTRANGEQFDLSLSSSPVRDLLPGGDPCENEREREGQNAGKLPGEATQTIAARVGWKRLSRGDIETLETWEEEHGTTALRGWMNDCIRDGYEPFPSKLRAYLPQRALPQRRNGQSIAAPDELRASHSAHLDRLADLYERLGEGGMNAMNLQQLRDAGRIPAGGGA